MCRSTRSRSTPHRRKTRRRSQRPPSTAHRFPWEAAARPAGRCRRPAHPLPRPLHWCLAPFPVRRSPRLSPDRPVPPSTCQRLRPAAAGIDSGWKDSRGRTVLGIDNRGSSGSYDEPSLSNATLSETSPPCLQKLTFLLDSAQKPTFRAFTLLNVRAGRDLTSSGHLSTCGPISTRPARRIRT
jgi:hypothetical protein